MHLEGSKLTGSRESFQTPRLRIINNVIPTGKSNFMKPFISTLPRIRSHNLFLIINHDGNRYRLGKIEKLFKNIFVKYKSYCLQVK